MLRVASAGAYYRYALATKVPLACGRSTRRDLIRWFFNRPQQTVKVYYPIEAAIEILKEQCDGQENAMFTVSVNLNLDPRIKGQKLKGVFEHPHSTGKACSVVAYTVDTSLAEEAVLAGATFAGDIRDRILNNEIQWPMHFERLIATQDLDTVVLPRKVLVERIKQCKLVDVQVPRMPSRLAAKLKRHKIVPSVEDKTLVIPEDMVRAVRGYSDGSYVQYVTDAHGNVSSRIGKVTMATTALVENFHSLLSHLFDTQPAVFGTGPRAKKGNIGKYVQSMHLTASMATPLRLDLDSIEILRERNHQFIPITKNWRQRT
jgi:large subunit ribosomal protein L1